MQTKSSTLYRTIDPMQKKPPPRGPPDLQSAATETPPQLSDPFPGSPQPEPGAAAITPCTPQGSRPAPLPAEGRKSRARTVARRPARPTVMPSARARGRAGNGKGAARGAVTHRGWKPQAEPEPHRRLTRRICCSSSLAAATPVHLSDFRFAESALQSLPPLPAATATPCSPPRHRGGGARRKWKNDTSGRHLDHFIQLRGVGW